MSDHTDTSDGFVADWNALRANDPEVADAIAGELKRERSTLRLIASENYASPAVLAAQASTMNNKYAEGYPGHRYYGGCRFVDVTEQLAIDRAKELFGADHANVQPHAGAQANVAVFGAFLEPRSEDKVLGLVLAHGGHLTHGSPVNVSGKWFTFVGYEVDPETEQLAIDRAKELFGADHANVQPHAGAQANVAVFGAFLEPRSEDKVLGLVLAHGGHLTHGSPVNVSGKWFTFVGYEVDPETERLDYDRIRDLAREHRPKVVLAGFTAYPRVIDWAAFRSIADEVGAILWVDASHFIGLCAGGAYPSPVPFADVVTFTTHKTLRGPRGAIILSREKHAKAIDKAVFPMMQGGPLEHVIAAKAVCLKEAMGPSFADYAARVVRTSRALAQGLADEGVRIVSGGTDSHLALCDLRPLGIGGKQAEAVCDQIGIAINKNGIPFDPQPPLDPSGIRVGTPGPATLGMDEPEMKEVSSIIGEALRHPGDEQVATASRARVAELVARFPAYPR